MNDNPDSAGGMSEETPHDPSDLWTTEANPVTGELTIANPEDDPWDSDHLLHLPNGARPVNPGPDLLEIYVAMVIGERSKDRDFSDKEALDRCKADVQTAITYILGWIEAGAPPGLEDEMKHRLTMIGIRGMRTRQSRGILGLTVTKS